MKRDQLPFRIAAWSNRVQVSFNSGGGAAMALYLVTGAAIIVFLFMTVHHRDPQETRKNDRYRRALIVWIEHGYFHHGGLAFKESVDQNPSQELWQSSSMGFLQGAHLLERMNYRFRGGFSDRLLVLHNQAIVLLSAALLGLMGMRSALGLGIAPRSAFVLGLACQTVYQTFPHNVWYYWEIYPTAVVSLIGIGWLICEEAGFERTIDKRWFMAVRTVAVFLLMWVEPYGSFFFVGTYVAVLFIVSPAEFKRVKVIFTVLTPAAAAVLLYTVQLLFVTIRYPLVKFTGNGFFFRTGLDGSREYMNGQWDLTTRRWPIPWLINRWPTLFLAGTAALVIVVVLYLTKVPRLRSSLFVLCTFSGLYVPFAFMFSQAAVIHPYGYDVYLVIPLIWALFALLPAALERLSSETGVLVYVSILTAFCFTWVQLRTYAMQFPLPH